MNQLSHFGIKGMKWGRRKAGGVSKERAPKPLKGVKALSDAELKAAVVRLQMEKQYKDLSKKDVSKGKKIVNDLLIVPAKTAIAAQATIMIGKAISDALKKVQK